MVPGSQIVTLVHGILKLLPHNEVVPTPTVRTFGPETGPEVAVEGSEQEVPPSLSVEVDPPPSPPHAARTPARVRSEMILLNLIDTYSEGNLFQNIRSAQDRAHMTRFFDHDVLGANLKWRSAARMAGLGFGSFVFLKITSEKMFHILFADTDLHNAENDTVC